MQQRCAKQGAQDCLIYSRSAGHNSCRRSTRARWPTVDGSWPCPDSRRPGRSRTDPGSPLRGGHPNGAGWFEIAATAQRPTTSSFEGAWIRAGAVRSSIGVIPPVPADIVHTDEDRRPVFVGGQSRLTAVMEMRLLLSPSPMSETVGSYFIRIGAGKHIARAATGTSAQSAS